MSPQKVGGSKPPQESARNQMVVREFRLCRREALARIANLFARMRFPGCKARTRAGVEHAMKVNSKVNQASGH